MIASTSASPPSSSSPKAMPLLVTRASSKPSARSDRSPGAIEPMIAAFATWSRTTTTTQTASIRSQARARAELTR